MFQPELLYPAMSNTQEQKNVNVDKRHSGVMLNTAHASCSHQSSHNSERESIARTRGYAKKARGYGQRTKFSNCLNDHL